MRWKKWLKRTAITILMVIVVRTIWLAGEREWLRAEGNHELVAATGEANQIDSGWRWEAVSGGRTKPPAGQNSAEIIDRIKATSEPDFAKPVSETQRSHLNQIAPNVRYPASVIAEVRRGLGSCPDRVKLVRTLHQIPYGHRDITLALNPLDTRLDHLETIRDIAALPEWDIVCAVEDEDYPLVKQIMFAAMNLPRSIGDEPLLLSQLVRMSMRTRALRRVEWVLAQTAGPEQLKLLGLEGYQAALAQDLEDPLLLHAIRGERATFDILFERLGNGTLDLRDIAGPRRSEDDTLSFHFGWWIYEGRFPGDRAFCLRWFNAAVEMARRPIHEQPPAFDSLPPIVLDEKRLLLRLLPAVNKVAWAHWRTQAEGRCTVVGIACERFRLKHGRWPESLSELSPELLAAVPLDPFDGQPLRYKKLDDGAVIYSMGTTTRDRTTTGARPGLPDGIEIGFRLWNPEARRQPAPPEPKAEIEP